MTDYSKIDRPEFLQFIFHPRAEAPSPLPGGAFDVDIQVDSDVTLGCRFYGTDQQSPTILYFHGNGETVNDHNEIAYKYNQFGINLFVATYRGYGWSNGTPTVASTLADAKVIYSFVLNWLSENNYTSSLFVMGRSLGSASAIEIASQEDANIKALILESGFADLAPLATSLGIDVSALDFTEADGFNNKAKMELIETPTYILHGQKDSLIPISEAEKLQSYCAARSKQFHIIPGAEHNTMISTAGDIYFQEIKKYIDTLLGVNSWRKRRKEFKEKQGMKK